MQEDDTSLYLPALETMRSLIRASTTSMTSVPKPLKFMRAHYPKMKEIHAKIMDAKIKDVNVGVCTQSLVGYFAYSY
jgi:26S proteasome regulatory subunit N1